ncbi:MAG: hypothetical protein NTV54_03410, partial [Ignavibacteriales bacterium]|nr:hypothetical protein [Ignavibacteriales bacterium]
VRGESSVGALFDANAVRSTPSPSQPGPGSYKFFSGGYTIFRHVVEDTSTVFGVQFELNEGLRSPDRRKSTAIMLVNVVMKYLRTQCGKNVENWMK